jgi:penicillin-binding protein 2
VFFIEERQERFPGVRIADSYLRRYPFRALGAQVLGHVGEVTKDQLEQTEDPSLAPGDEVGQAGIESTYDKFLRGRSGSARLRVDSLGRPRGGLIPSQEPSPGYALRLTIDAKLQQAAERALRYGIEQAHATDEWYADGGAIVAMDPRNGQILALASNPTYKPSLFVGRVEAKKLAAAGLANSTAEAKNYPALNRALAGQYPPGSTWKPVTALAAMEAHLFEPYSSLPCTPSYTYEGENGVDYNFLNWTSAFDVGMTLPQALEASCNTYFYELGRRFYELPPEQGHPFQTTARRFGFGETSGLDIGGEAAGLLPTPEWRKRTYKNAIDKLWKPGDSIQLAIGQKDLLVTPLQMARFYALVANGGKLVRPHVVQDVQEGADTVRSPARVVHSFTAPAPKSVGLDPYYLQAVQDGLWQATHSDNGTATGVFGTFPIAIAGKTGTAQKNPNTDQLDQSWWCGYGPADGTEPPELVVCALIENGGFGADAAAPAALRVFKEFFRDRLGTTGAVVP